MKIVIQKVTSAQVRLSQDVPAQDNPRTPESAVDSPDSRRISLGFVLLVAVADSDGRAETAWAAKKIAHLRVFEDNHGKMNLSILDVVGQILSISQFTLFADISRGNRPSFVKAGHKEHAEKMWQEVNQILQSDYHIHVKTGWFGAHMEVDLVNDGPVTILLDTEQDMPH